MLNALLTSEDKTAGYSERASPEVVAAYQDVLVETGLTPEADMLCGCQGSYTFVQHLRLVQRQNQLPLEGA
ncbi:hypothetical protein H5A33_11145 [Pectobacterium brasiliense]|uniref:hypothetical protein n=1 Tax=Pectobacterium brasiliense TaxID=180957 RepID=UPI001968D1AC|nr:hypothetical protein [Pectobacterium brasiliense]MBN3255183.1 hypothetical protein [Pectobacterium brasiliense]